MHPSPNALENMSADELRSYRAEVVRKRDRLGDDNGAYTKRIELIDRILKEDNNG